MAPEKTKVFISYSRRDRTFVEGLADALEEKGIAVYRDVEHILPTEEWKDRIEKLVGETDTMVFVISPDSVASEVCAWEIRLVERLNKRLAPIVYRDAQDLAIPEGISKLNYVFFTENQAFDRSLEMLVAALDTDIDWIREHTRLGEQARRWDRRRRLGARLLRGPELTAPERWLAAQPRDAPGPTGMHRAFIAESRRSATRRQGYWVGGSLAIAGATAVLAVFAYLQQQEAQRRLQVALQTTVGFVNRATRVTADPAIPRSVAIPLTSRADAAYKQLAKDGFTTPGMRRAQVFLLLTFAKVYASLNGWDSVLVRAREAQDVLRLMIRSDEGNPGLWRELALSHEYAGFAQKARGDLQSALKEQSEALDIRQRFARRDPQEEKWVLDLFQSYRHTGDVMRAQGKIAEALEMARKADGVAESRIEAAPGSIKWRKRLAENQVNRGALLWAQTDRQGGLAAFRRAIEIRQRLADAAPGDYELKRELSESFMQIGLNFASNNATDDALSAFGSGRTLLIQLARTDPSHFKTKEQLARAHSLFAEMQMRKGRRAVALDAMRQSLAIRKDLAARDPGDPILLGELADGHRLLGNLFFEERRFRESLAGYRAELVLRQALLRRKPKLASRREGVVATQYRIGLALTEFGDAETALATFHAVLETLADLIEGNPDARRIQRQRATIHYKIGDIQAGLGNKSAAITAFDRGVALARALARQNPDWKDVAQDVKEFDDRLAKLRAADAK